MTATDARTRLISLQMERFEAREAGVTLDSYLARLELSISDARYEYAVAAMTEIAALRTELSHPLPADGSPAT
jgi:hypothetical protein